MSRLLALSTELLYSITEDVVTYDDRGPRLYWSESKGAREHRGSLLNLALTCKTFADIALPLLYRHPSTLSPSGVHNVATSMIRTLCSRPDLAAHVAELSLGGAASIFSDNVDPDWELLHKREWQISPAETELFNQGFRDHQINVHEIVDNNGADDGKETFESFQLQAIKAPSDSTCEGRWSEDACSALSGLAIVKSPNVRCINLATAHWSLPRTVKPLITFSKLTELHWSHADMEGGFIADDSLNWLLAAAPALRKLSLECAVELRGFAPCSVTELKLNVCSFNEDSVRAMCEAFPKLERLQFGVSADDYTREIATAVFVVVHLVESYAMSLTHLDMNWSGADEEMGYWDDAAVSLAGLASMTALTELVLDSPFLHRRSGDTGTEKDFWASLLAPNLEFLHFSHMHGDWNALALTAAFKEKCPNMKRVIVHCKKAPRDAAAFRRLCESKSIGLEFRYIVFGSAVVSEPNPVEDNGSDDDGSDGHNHEDDGHGGVDDVEAII